MPAVLNIIRNRWAEVLLIVLVQTGLAILMLQIVGNSTNSEEAMKKLTEISAGKQFLLTFGSSAMLVLWAIMCIGFLVTAYKEGAVQQQPATLIIAGRSFFWRMAFIYFQLSLISIIISQMFAQVAANTFTDTAPEKIMLYAIMATKVAIVKPILLMPAIIVVKNCGIIDSFKHMGHYRLIGAKGLTKLIAICYAGMFIPLIIAIELKLEGVTDQILQAVTYTVNGTLMLAVYLGAIGYVASLEPEPEPAEDAEKL